MTKIILATISIPMAITPIFISTTNSSCISIILIVISIILFTTTILVGTNEVGEGPWLAALPPHYLLVIILPRPAARILTTSRRNLECAECLKRDHHCLGKISGMH